MRTFIAGLVALTLSACSSEPSLLDIHVSAMGGESALESIEGIQIELDISEPSFTVTGRYIARRNGDVRVDIYDGGTRVFSEGLSNGIGWQMFGDGRVEPTSEAGTGALYRGGQRNVYGLHELEQRGHSVLEGEPETIDGLTYLTLDIVMDDGFEERLYLDPESLLPVRSRSEYALHPDLDPEVDRHETRYSDFREIAGVMRSFLQETVDLRTGEIVQTVRITAIEINPDFEEGAFERPTAE